MNNVIFQLVAIPFAAFFCFVTPVTASDPWDADPLSNPGTRDGSHFVSVSLLSDNEDGKSLFQGRGQPTQQGTEKGGSSEGSFPDEQTSLLENQTVVIYPSPRQMLTGFQQLPGSNRCCWITTGVVTLTGSIAITGTFAYLLYYHVIL
jgi:hypothetical protein